MKIVAVNREERVNVGLEQKLFDACAETAAGIGHELNNPLAIIAGQAQNLLKNETSEEKRRRLAAILDQTARAYEMIVDLRTFARPPRPTLAEVDVKKFFDEWARREEKRCEEYGTRLETSFEVAENTSTLTTDETMLAAILNALTKNAAEATGVGGVVRISVREVVFESAFDLRREESDGGENGVNSLEKDLTLPEIEEKKAKTARWLEFGVEDNGPGLSLEARELLFAPYFSGRQAGRGLGVGLAKARRLAEALDVELRCAEATAFESGVFWRVLARF